MTEAKKPVRKTAKKTAAPVTVTVEDIRAAGEFAMVKQEDVAHLLEAGLVEVNPAIADEDGRIACRVKPEVTQMEEVAQVAETVHNEITETADQPAEPAKKGTKMSFIIAAVELPEVSRAGRGPKGGESRYPFAELQVGQSFFVPNEEGKVDKDGNPITAVKSMGSTVAGARARYSHECPTGETRTNRKGDVVPVMIQDRDFAVRAVADGAPWGQPGVAGAGIWRTL